MKALILMNFVSTPLVSIEPRIDARKLLCCTLRQWRTFIPEFWYFDITENQMEFTQRASAVISFNSSRSISLALSSSWRSAVFLV